MIPSPLPKIGIFYTQVCRRKRSFQWYPDQSDQLNRAWNTSTKCSEMWVKYSWQISCGYTWQLHGKNCPSGWCFHRNFWTGSKPNRRSITVAKKIRRGEKGRARKSNKKNEKPQVVGYFLNLICAHAWAKMSWNAILGERKACCPVANAVFRRLQLIWQISPKCRKMHFWQNVPGIYGLFNLFIHLISPGFLAGKPQQRKPITAVP